MDFNSNRPVGFGMGLKNLVLGGMLTALGVLLPIMFHAAGLGKAFLPMHIPVFLAGFFCGPSVAALVGAITPILSSVFTGMPPLTPPVAQGMVAELSVYGFITGTLFWKARLGVYVTLFSSMLGGRIVYGILAYLLLPLFGIPKVPLWAPLATAVAQSLPGLIVQIVVIPGVVSLVTRNAKMLFAIRRPKEESL